MKRKIERTYSLSKEDLQDAIAGWLESKDYESPRDDDEVRVAVNPHSDEELITIEWITEV